MKKIRHIFFDRDETLLYQDKSLRDKALFHIADRLDLDFSYVTGHYNIWYEYINERIIEDWRKINTREKEISFWMDGFEMFYDMLFDSSRNSAEKKAAVGLFYDNLLYYKVYNMFDDVLETLQALKGLNYQMGVISDTLPMLKESLAHFQLSEYFDSFTAAADIGCLKPDPLIFKKALGSMNADSEHSLYIDDRPEKMQGLDKIGIRAVLIDRKDLHPEAENKIRNLAEIIDYLME